MTHLEKYTEETKRSPFCWNKKGEYVSNASYSDDYVNWLESKVYDINNFYCKDKSYHMVDKCTKQCSDCMDYLEKNRFKNNKTN